MSGSREEEAARPHEAAHARSVRAAGFVEFYDESHLHWRVTERDARHDPGARGDWCLIFVCADAVRRVWAYPADWRDLPAAALIALSRGR